MVAAVAVVEEVVQVEVEEVVQVVEGEEVDVGDGTADTGALEALVTAMDTTGTTRCIGLTIPTTIHPSFKSLPLLLQR